MLTNRGQFVDINGDGLVDWVGAYHKWTGGRDNSDYQIDSSGRWKDVGSAGNTYLNTGNGWQIAPGYRLPDDFVEHRGPYTIGHGQLIDLNGDGLLDWLQAYHQNENGVSHKNAWFNTGSGFTSAPNHFNLPDMLYENVGSWYYPRTRGSFIDLNGDGLRDFILDSEGGGAGNGYTDDKLAYLNTGNGWLAASGYDAPAIHKDHTYQSHPWPVQTHGYYLDINRDGLVDFVQSFIDVNDNHIENTWLNTGTGWESDTEDSYNVGMPFYDYSDQETTKVRFGQFIDINSDGVLDWVQSREGAAFATKLNSMMHVNQLSKVTTTMGVEIKPSFASLTENGDLYTKGTGTAEVDAFHLISPMYVTSQLKVSNPIGTGYITSEYQYGGAQVNRKGRGFLGFKWRKVIGVTSKIGQYSEYNQTFPYVGTMANSRSFQTTNPTGWISKTTNTFDHYSTAVNKTLSVYAKESIVENAELASGSLENVQGAQYSWVKKTSNYLLTSSSTVNDPYGNLRSVTTQTGINSSTIQHESTVTNTYHSAQTANWLIGQLETVTSAAQKHTPSGADSTSLITRNQNFTYTTEGSVWENTREEQAGSKVKLITTYDYDAYGNVTEEKIESTGVDAEIRINEIAYDTDNRLPWKLTDALDQFSTIIYDDFCDQPQKATDIDGQETRFTYDGYCRQTSATVELGEVDVVSTTAYTHAYTNSDGELETPTIACSVDNPALSYTGGSCQVAPSLQVVSNTDGQAPVTTLFNAHNKPISTKTEGMVSTQKIEQRTNYDHLGRVIGQTQPYFSGETQYWTFSQYDYLNRVIETELPYPGESPMLSANGNAKVTMVYSVDSLGRRESVSRNTLNEPKKTYTNALGQVAEIIDALDGSLKYTYDSYGNLTETLDAQDNKITVGYDVLGRRISLDDPDLGLRTFTLDAFGQIRRGYINLY